MSSLGGPNIITNGLILSLDAANSKYAPSRNLLRYTNDLANAAWGKNNSQITASAGIAPDGTNTAFAWNSTTSSSLLTARISCTSISSSINRGPHIFSVFVKQKDANQATIQTGVYDNSTILAGTEPNFSIPSFQPTGSANSNTINRTSEFYGDGWYRISTAVNLSSTTSSIYNYQVFLDLAVDSGGTNDIGKGVYLWGPQFEAGTVATTYQPIVANNKTWPSIINPLLNATLYNNTTYTGSNAGTMLFNGINQYANVTAPVSYLSSSITDVFFKVGSYSGTGFFALAGYDFNGGNYSNGTTGIIYISNTGIVYGSIIAASQTYRSVSSTSVIIPDKYYMATLYKDTTNGILKLYINGVLESTNTFDPATYAQWPTAGTYIGNNTFTVGNYASTNWGTGPYFNGSIASAKLYGRLLSDSEILQNYNATKGRFNL
jgi:hypothetical protein